MPDILLANRTPYTNPLRLGETNRSHRRTDSTRNAPMLPVPSSRCTLANSKAKSLTPGARQPAQRLSRALSQGPRPTSPTNVWEMRYSTDLGLGVQTSPHSSVHQSNTTMSAFFYSPRDQSTASYSTIPFLPKVQIACDDLVRPIWEPMRLHHPLLVQAGRAVPKSVDTGCGDLS